MKSINNILMAGLGAIGGAYASKLYEMNPEGIKVLAGGERAKRYIEKGFLINGKKYNFTYADPEEHLQPADLIIVSVKAHQLNRVIKDMKNYVGDNTIILSLLNGITSEEILGKEFGMDKILYGLCIAIDGNRNGNEIRFSSYGNINFGEKTNKVYSQKVQAVEDLFRKANMPYTIPEDMMRCLWYKFMINVGINQSSAVLRGPYGVFQTIDEAKELMESAMWEVVKISQKIGINLNEKDISNWYEVLATMNPNSKTSMLGDIECGRKTEVELFGETVCNLGKKYRVDTPVNKTLCNIIKVLEKSA